MDESFQENSNFDVRYVYDTKHVKYSSCTFCRRALKSLLIDDLCKTTSPSIQGRIHGEHN